jgi:hypothetical protein
LIFPLCFLNFQNELLFFTENFTTKNNYFNFENYSFFFDFHNYRKLNFVNLGEPTKSLAKALRMLAEGGDAFNFFVENFTIKNNCFNFENYSFFFDFHNYHKLNFVNLGKLKNPHTTSLFAFTIDYGVLNFFTKHYTVESNYFHFKDYLSFFSLPKRDEPNIIFLSFETLTLLIKKFI